VGGLAAYPFIRRTISNLNAFSSLCLSGKLGSDPIGIAIRIPISLSTKDEIRAKKVRV